MNYILTNGHKVAHELNCTTRPKHTEQQYHMQLVHTVVSIIEDQSCTSLPIIKYIPSKVAMIEWCYTLLYVSLKEIQQ